MHSPHVLCEKTKIAKKRANGIPIECKVVNQKRNMINKTREIGLKSNACVGQKQPREERLARSEATRWEESSLTKLTHFVVATSQRAAWMVHSNNEKD